MIWEISAGKFSLRSSREIVDLIFQDDVSERLLGCVGQRERYIFRAEPGCDGGSLPVKLNGGTLALGPHHLNIAPADAVTPSCTERLHASLFGGEACGIALAAVGSSFAISNFASGEDALKKSVAKALDAFADAGNFGDVHSRAQDHGDIVNR